MKRISCFLLSLLLLVACVPTPTEEYVTNRMDGKMQQVILSPKADPYKYIAPSEWKESFEVRGQNVTIDAVVEVSSDVLHPVYTIQNDWFDKNTLQGVLNRVLSSPLKIREGDRSYEELLVDLMNVERGHVDDWDDETGEIIYVSYPGQGDDIAKLKELLSETPVEETYRDISKSDLILPIQNKRLMDGNGDKWYLDVYQNSLNISKLRSVHYQPETWVEKRGAYPGEKGHKLENIQISEEKAVRLGNEWITKFERNDLCLARIDRGRLLEKYTYRTWEGYALYYVSKLDGCIPTCYVLDGDCSELSFSNISETDIYAMPWRQEYIFLFINEDGVQVMNWCERKTIEMVPNENVQLMPFDQIQQSIRSLLQYGLSGDENNPVTIHRIVLGNAIQQVPNQKDEAFIIPTWIIYLYSEAEHQGSNDLRIMLVNALDGTFVSRSGRSG
jgi:hypothetical protein